MRINNRSSMEDALAERILSMAIEYYEKKWPYGKPKAEVEFTLVSSAEELEEVWRIYYGLGKNQHLPNFDGQFLTPHGRADILSITLWVKEKHIQGIKQFLSEVEGGSLKDAPGVDMDKRGTALMGAFTFLETVLHEYTHLCLYETFMEATNWTKADLLDDINLYLHDEFLGRYVGMRSALEMMKSYMEPNLFGSLFMMYSQDDMKSLQEEREQAHSFLKEQKKQLAQMASGYGMSKEEFLKGVEEELGRPISSKGLSDLDMAEYMAFGPMKAVGERYMLLCKNPLASRAGTQLLGTLRGFYEGGKDLFLGQEEGLPREELFLQNVYQVPFDEVFTQEDVAFYLQELPEMLQEYL